MVIVQRLTKVLQREQSRIMEMMTMKVTWITKLFSILQSLIILKIQLLTSWRVIFILNKINKYYFSIVYCYIKMLSIFKRNFRRRPQLLLRMNLMSLLNAPHQAGPLLLLLPPYKRRQMYCHAARLLSKPTLTQQTALVQKHPLLGSMSLRLRVWVLIFSLHWI